MRRIRLVADDYALAPGVSAAIRELAGAGRLSATSVMVVVPGFPEEAARLAARTTPRPFAIGLHLTLTGGFRPLSAHYAPTTGEGTFPAIAALMAQAFAGRLDPAVIRAEVEAQLDAFAAGFGRLPDYVDGHQHVQLLPRIRGAVLDVVADRLPGAWVRQCGPAGRAPNPLRDPKGALLAQLSRAFRAKAQARGIAVNPGFAGSYLYQPDADFTALFPGFLKDSAGRRGGDVPPRQGRRRSHRPRPAHDPPRGGTRLPLRRWPAGGAGRGRGRAGVIACP